MTDELPLLDPAALAELRESVGGDDDFVRELAAAYLAEGPNDLAALAAAAAAGDAAGTVRPAHTLKSSSAALGAARLAALCRQIEYAGREGRVASADEVATVQSTWQATAQALAAAGLAP
jgi:HPt (histidine-containing phosphotransfer) domain-containing protein